MNKKVVILGAAESGLGAAILARKHGIQVFVSDSGIIKPKYKDLLTALQIDHEEQKHTEERIFEADEIIKSPGIDPRLPIIKAIKKKNIPIISEIEFAGRYTNAKLICVTGSNGKTTTTSMIYHMMLKAGLNCGMAGNIGKSFAMQVAENQFDYYVIELSSFQLENMYEFKADIAILLNITPDHLDRYDNNLQNYVDAKFRITQNLIPDNYFIFCSDDELTVNNLDKIVRRARELTFTLSGKKCEGAYVDDRNMVIQYDETDFSMSLEELSLKGKHNVYNSMAAGITGSILRIKNEVIRESLMDFKGVEHRLENVMRIRNIDFINDSKATNVNSSWYALESMKTDVIWIVGGQDKGNNYDELKELVKQKVKAIVCLGVDNKKLLKTFGKTVETIVETNTMWDAVQSAYFLAKTGDTVLLSPACASFDLFTNYEDRGKQFKDCIRKL